MSSNDDDYGLKPLHRKIMEIMDYVHALCEKHGIRYYAIGGTAIGAVRHQGFIPWDDDLDIMMPYEDYYKFIDVCENELDSEKFYLQKEFTAELPKPFCKIRMNNTTYIEAVNPKHGMHQGIFIDVMCMHKAPDSDFSRKLQFFAAKVVAAKGLSMVNYNPPSTARKIFIKAASFLPQNFVFKRVTGFVARWNKKDTQTACHIYGRAGFARSFFPAELVGEQKFVPFENSTMSVFEHVEEFLAIRFGDYMKLPPHEERLADQHALKVDTERDYSFYTE